MPADRPEGSAGEDLVKRQNALDIVAMLMGNPNLDEPTLDRVKLGVMALSSASTPPARAGAWTLTDLEILVAYMSAEANAREAQPDQEQAAHLAGLRAVALLAAGPPAATSDSVLLSRLDDLERVLREPCTRLDRKEAGRIISRIRNDAAAAPSSAKDNEVTREARVLLNALDRQDADRSRPTTAHVLDIMYSRQQLRAALSRRATELDVTHVKSGSIDCVYCTCPPDSTDRSTCRIHGFLTTPGGAA